MKKLIALACAAAVGAGAFALDLSVGARGNFNMGLGTTLAEDYKAMADNADSKGGNIGGGFGIYANVGFVDLGFMTLGVQPEFDMNFNNGYHVKNTYGDTTMTTTLTGTTIDIPLLITANVPVTDAIKVGFGVGPYLSIPFGVDIVMSDGTEKVGFAEMMADEMGGDKNKFKFTSGINFGLAIDANAGFKVGPGNIVADVRYLLDFTPTKVTGNDGTKYDEARDVFTRRALTIGLGYEVTFSF